MFSSTHSVFSDKSKEDLIKEISQIRKNIKHKHRSMKRELLDTEEMWEKQLKPISEPLKRIVEEGEKLQQIQLKEEEEDAEQEKIDKPNKLKRKSGVEDIEIPFKRYILPAPQGKKRKHTSKDITPVDVTPVSKRFVPNKDNIDQQNTDMYHEETMEESDNNPQDAVEDNMLLEETFESPAVVSAEDMLKTPQGRNMAREYILSEFKGNIAKEYFLKLLKGGKEVDHNYGIRVEGNQWMIGNKPLEIDIDDFLIDGIRYEGTRGLYELLFMNIPNPYVYSEEDLNSYAAILRTTNAHKLNYLSTGKVKSNRGNKYKNIISQLVLREKEALNNPMGTYSDLVRDTVTGSGIVLTDAKPNYIYYDDPNELVDRLRILKSSEDTGHTGHLNEINSILEELQELDSQCINDTGKSIVD